MAAPKDDAAPDPLEPRRNTAFRGHAGAERAVLDAWSAKRMPHAWLFTGPSGIGKASFAFRVARFVLTGGGEAGLFGDGPTSLDIDPELGAVRRIAAGGHPDMRVIERGMMNDSNKVTESIINAYQARKAVEFLYQTPAESDWKVLIVDRADDLNPQSANALLKVMEEPPARSLILLTADRPGALLPTIRSRCRVLPMRPLDDADVLALLGQRLPELEAEEARLLAALAEGSIGRALALHRSGGIALYRGLVTLLAGLGRLDPADVHGLADGFAGKGADRGFETFRELLSGWGARHLRAEAAGEPAPAILPEEAEAASALRRMPGNLPARLDIWRRAEDHLARTDAPANLDRRMVILRAFLELDAAARGG